MKLALPSLVLSLVICLLLFGALSSANASERVALVIGNGAYRHTAALPNPRNDAKAVGATLAQLGFDVDTQLDLSKTDFDRSLRQFGDRLERADVALFYYAGHGIQVNGENYLVPIDARLRKKRDLNYEVVKLTHVLGEMETRRRFNLVFLDACRDNPLGRSLATDRSMTRSMVGRGLARVDAATGTLISYATKDGAVASDGQGQHSPYTQALLKHIKTPNLDIGLMLRRVRRSVMQATGEQQVPWEYGSLLGEFYMAGARVESIPPPETYWQAAKPQKGDEWRDPIMGMAFVWVPGGCYRVGSNEGDSDEKPVHEVCVDGFWMGKYEVTQGQWEKVMGNNPSKFKKGNNHPVERVSWNDTQEFIRKLGAKGQGSFRLPTEAEWEYACRSGGKQEKYCGGNDLNRVAWYGENSGKQTHAVGKKAGNGLGLYDMSGNVWEWVGDWYDTGYYLKSPKNDPKGPGKDAERVFRGGGWSSNPAYVRAALRLRGTPGLRYFILGFRLLRTGP